MITIKCGALSFQSISYHIYRCMWFKSLQILNFFSPNLCSMVIFRGWLSITLWKLNFYLLHMADYTILIFIWTRAESGRVFRYWTMIQSGARLPSWMVIFLSLVQRQSLSIDICLGFFLKQGDKRGYEWKDNSVVK
jgi:hypothetical protein